MVYFLHIRNGYEIGMDEDLLVKEFSTWYQEYSGQATAESEIRTAVDNLYNQKIFGYKFWEDLFERAGSRTYIVLKPAEK